MKNVSIFLGIVYGTTSCVLFRNPYTVEKRTKTYTDDKRFLRAVGAARGGPGLTAGRGQGGEWGVGTIRPVCPLRVTQPPHRCRI